MDLNSIHFSEVWYWAHFIYWPVFLWALYRAPWSIILEKEASNILFASCAVIFLFWHMKVHVADGLNIHLLGSTILTLMFRWQVAILSNAIILFGITISSVANLEAFAMNGLLSGVIPIMLSYLMWRINETYLPANYFVYIFFAGFLGGGLSLIVTGLLSYELLSLVENQLSAETLKQYLLAYIPLMYPEAFITGAVISVLVIYKPEWISTFDDRRYLHNK